MKRKVLLSGWIRQHKTSGFIPFVMYKTRKEARDAIANIPEYYRKEYKIMHTELVKTNK